MNPGLIKQKLELLGLNQLQVFCFDQVDSVLDAAKRYSQKAANELSPSYFIAETQSSGRGQKGRSWISLQGAYLGCLQISLAVPTTLLSQLSLLAAISVSKSIEQLGAATELKWPNDVLLARNHKKIAGILIESDARFVRIGIGVNLSSSPFFAAALIDDPAAKKCSLEDYAVLLANILIEDLRQFQDLALQPYIEYWRKRDVLIDQPLIIEQSKQKIFAKGQGVNENGNLLLNIDGQVKSFSSSEIIYYQVK